MRIMKLAIAAAIAVGSMGLAATSADAQRGDGWRDNNARWHDGDRWRDNDRRDRRWHNARGNHYGWRNNRRHCRWVWRHHHRQRICRWGRW